MTLLTPPDRDRCRWRIELLSGGRVRVRPQAMGSPAGYLVSLPTTMHELGGWLVERGIDPEQLEEI